MLRWLPVIICRATAIARRAAAGRRSRSRSRPRYTPVSSASRPVARDARVLERLPGELQHEALLRVHGRGLPRGDAEEAGVESVDAVQVPPVLQALRGLVGLGEPVQRPPLGRGLDDRVAAFVQKLPERVGVGRAGQAARHPDYGDFTAMACPWPPDPW